MNTHDETAEDSVTTSVNGFDELILTDDDTAVRVTVGSADRWDRSHLRRLRQSADLPGLVPVIDSDFASDGKPFAVTPVINEPTLASMIPPSGPAWQDCAAVTEAAARATHEAHLRGLFHGALSPDQIHVIGDDVAVAGIGLGLGGTPRADYHHWVAPEVLDGIDATERSDVYSLGKILEASLGDSLEDVPRSVRRLIMWSGSDTPEARPPSALEFASILAEALGDDRKTYSPAFIPTAEANALAATASGVVAAHTPSGPSAAAGLGAAAAVGGAAAASTLLGDEAEEMTVDEELVDEGLFDDSGVDIIEEDDTDLIEDEAAEPVEDYDEIPEDAVITGEVEMDDEALDASAATETVQLEADTVDEQTDTEPAFDSREYSRGIDEAATETTDEFEVPAARTVEIEPTYQEESRGNRAGILVGAILAAGLAFIAWGLIRSNDTDGETAEDVAGAVEEDETTETTGTEAETTVEEGDADDATSEAAAPATDEDGSATASTADEATEDDAATETTVAEQTTTSEQQTTTTEQQTTTTESEPAEAAVATVPLQSGAISADEAALQIVHGIPGVDVDVYVDGNAVVPGFTASDIAGPVELASGSHVIDLYQAVAGAPALAGDRTDSPIISETVSVSSQPTSLFAHLDANGQPTLSGFAENLTRTDPAEGRVVVRHLAQAPAVTVSVDGEPVANGELSNGEFVTVALEAGDHTISASTADGTTVAEATIGVGDGELASITVFGSAEGNNLSAVVQRFTGLSSAPSEVPTGNSNLLGMDEDMTNLYLVGVMTLVMAAAGGVVMARRRRIL